MVDRAVVYFQFLLSAPSFLWVLGCSIPVARKDVSAAQDREILVVSQLEHSALLPYIPAVWTRRRRRRCCCCCCWRTKRSNQMPLTCSFGRPLSAACEAKSQTKRLESNAQRGGRRDQVISYFDASPLSIPHQSIHPSRRTMLSHHRTTVHGPP
jgi:hypothetical protein